MVVGTTVVVEVTTPVDEVTEVTTVVEGAGAAIVVGTEATVDHDVDVVDVVVELTESAGWISCTGFGDELVAIATTPTPIAAAARTPPTMPFSPGVAMQPLSATLARMSTEAQ